MYVHRRRRHLLPQPDKRDRWAALVKPLSRGTQEGLGRRNIWRRCSTFTERVGD